MREQWIIFFIGVFVALIPYVLGFPPDWDNLLVTIGGALIAILAFKTIRKVAQREGPHDEEMES